MQDNQVVTQQNPVENNPIAHKDQLIEAIKKSDVEQIKLLFGGNQREGLPVISPDYKDDKGRNALHIAVEFGDTICDIICVIKFLVEEIRIDATAKDNAGYTPFHLAIIHDKTTLAQRLCICCHQAMEIPDNNNCTTLDSAISKKNDKIISAILIFYPKFIKCFYADEKRAEIYEAILKIALESDNVELFKQIIVKHRPINQEALKNLPEDTKIKKLLAYKPGKGYTDLKFDILQKDYDFGTVTNTLYDNLLSSEAESSESSDFENEEYHPLREKEDQKSKVLTRGFHFSPTHLRTTAKRNAVINSSHDKPVYSLATTKLAEEHRKTLEHADELIKGYFETLKITPDKPELKEDYTKRNRQIQGEAKKFETLYHRFVHAYVNPHGYDDLFNKGGAQRNFNFFSNNNPTLSTTPDLPVAAEYATGHRITEIARYYPKVRRSTGKLKHRKLGYVEVYAISEEYYRKHVIDVDKLKLDNKISIAHNQSFNKEEIIESSIPKEFILGYQVFSLPSFNKEWSESIQKRYGLNKATYDSYRENLFNDWLYRRELLKEIIVKVTAYQTQKMQASIQANLAKIGKNEDKANKVNSTALQIAKSDEGQHSCFSEEDSINADSKEKTASISQLTSSVQKSTIQTNFFKPAKEVVHEKKNISTNISSKHARRKTF